MKVKAKSDTLFKLQPVLSSELTDAEKVFVENGAEYEIDFYTEIDDHHLRLELVDAALPQHSSLTWYVRKSDIDVEGSTVISRTVRDTLFKRQPTLSSDLSDNDKVFVAEGKEFELESFIPAADKHTKLTLSNGGLGSQPGKTWYVHGPDIKVMGQKITLRTTSDTLFKAKLTTANALASTDKAFVPKHTILELQSYAAVEGSYLRITLAKDALGPDERVTWYAFSPDIEIIGTEPNNRPDDSNSYTSKEQPVSDDRGQPLKFPGFQGTYYTSDPILSGGHFTWGQATHGGSRIPVSTEIVYGIIRIAEAMEEIRVMLGDRPIYIKSWYRNPAANLRVGGASTSRHLNGDAIDFVVEGYHPYDVFSRLDPWWRTRGGLASSTEFIHIDARGYRARWDYGF